MLGVVPGCRFWKKSAHILWFLFESHPIIWIAPQLFVIINYYWYSIIFFIKDTHPETAAQLDLDIVQALLIPSFQILRYDIIKIQLHQLMYFKLYHAPCVDYVTMISIWIGSSLLQSWKKWSVKTRVIIIQYLSHLAIILWVRSATSVPSFSNIKIALLEREKGGHFECIIQWSL